MGSEGWAEATAWAFDVLTEEPCDAVAKPEWWNDEGLKALSARVVRAAPNDASAHIMRANVLFGRRGAWEAGPRSAAELNEAAAHFDRSAALSTAPAVKAEKALFADWCRIEAEAKAVFLRRRRRGLCLCLSSRQRRRAAAAFRRATMSVSSDVSATYMLHAHAHAMYMY